MASPLTESEKERCRYHLGYMETSFGGNQAAASLQLGIPKPLQTVFLLESAIQTLLVNPHAVDRVRRTLDTLDTLEEQIRNAACTLVADKLGDLQLHPLRNKGKLFTDSLEDEYRRWAYRLSDILGVPIYPYSTRLRQRGPGRNVPVVG